MVHRTEKHFHTIRFHGRTEYAAASICLTLPHSSNLQLSPTLQFRSHSGREVTLCHGKWVHKGGVGDRGRLLVNNLVTVKKEITNIGQHTTLPVKTIYNKMLNGQKKKGNTARVCHLQRVSGMS